MRPKRLHRPNCWQHGPTNSRARHATSSSDLTDALSRYRCMKKDEANTGLFRFHPRFTHDPSDSEITRSCSWNFEANQSPGLNCSISRISSLFPDSLAQSYAVWPVELITVRLAPCRTKASMTSGFGFDWAALIKGVTPYSSTPLRSAPKPTRVILPHFLGHMVMPHAATRMSLGIGIPSVSAGAFDCSRFRCTRTHGPWPLAGSQSVLREWPPL